MQIHRFPPEMRNDSTNRYPCMNFTALKFINKTFINENESGSSTFNINGTPGEKHLLESFWLPLPQDITNVNNLNWEMTDLKVIKGLVDALEQDNIINAGTQIAGTLASVAFDRIAGIATARTPNPKKQALFNGIEPRTFTFNWIFSPETLHEAEVIQRIIKGFNFHVLPSLETENSNFYSFPSEFEIKFHNVAGFPVISNCVCTNMQTNYNPNVVGLLQSGHSVQTSLSLTFLETELLRKEKPGIQQGLVLNDRINPGERR